ncbi:MAG: FHA domain-containing protein, partial [Planctomycetes bacterium]|nr:FHA domain-containing protein [Planctomycetota bacterium]
DRTSISKIHCLIVRTDGLLFIRDLGSTNGTKVNGQRVIRGALLPGDELAFAGEKFRVEMGPGEPDDGAEDIHDLKTEAIDLANVNLRSDYQSISEPSGSEVGESDLGKSDLEKSDGGGLRLADDNGSDSDVRLIED